MIKLLSKLLLISILIFISVYSFGQKHEIKALVLSSNYKLSEKISYNNVLSNHAFDFGLAYKRNFIEKTGEKNYFSLKTQLQASTRRFETNTELNETARVKEDLAEFAVLIMYNSTGKDDKIGFSTGIGTNLTSIIGQEVFFNPTFNVPENVKLNNEFGAYYKFGLSAEFNLNFKTNDKKALTIGIFGSKDLSIINKQDNFNYKFDVIGIKCGYTIFSK